MVSAPPLLANPSQSLRHQIYEVPAPSRDNHFPRFPHLIIITRPISLSSTGSSTHFPDDQSVLNLPSFSVFRTTCSIVARFFRFRHNGHAKVAGNGNRDLRTTNSELSDFSAEHLATTTPRESA